MMKIVVQQIRKVKLKDNFIKYFYKNYFIK